MPQIVNLGTPTSPTIYTKKYGSFRGVDFSQSETMVDDSRSPHAVNLISDTGGFPEKRVGWRTLKKLDGRINGIYHYKGTVKQKAEIEGEEETETHVDCFVIHAGTKIYSWSGNDADEPRELLSGINDARSTGKNFKGKFFILTGEEMLESDGLSCVNVTEGDGAYVPTTRKSRVPARINYDEAKKEDTMQWYPDEDENPLGEAYQEVNLITARRKNTFKNHHRSGQDAYYGKHYFYLDGEIDLGTRVVMRYIPTGEVWLDFIMDADTKAIQIKRGDISDEGYNALRQQFSSSGVDAGEIAYIQVSRNGHKYPIQGTNRVTMDIDTEITNCGVIRTHMHVNGDEDNIEIEYSSTPEGYGNRLPKCTTMDIFENRIFYSGSPEYPNTDWYSMVNEPTYVTDLNYTDIGLDEVPIMGYLRLGDQQVILKGEGEDATMYLRSYATLEDGTVIFPVKQGTSGVGAIARRAICSLLDDPMYLSSNGVYAVAMQDISSERALNIRSTRINKKLLKHMNLEDAYMCTWRDNLMLFINGECYVADAAQKSYSGNKTGTFEYEWYYWTNIPARVAFEHEGALFFGTEDGRVCRFNDDMKNSRGEIESRAYSDDGEAIVAEWATNLSDDGDFMRLKTMKKKGSGVMLKTYNRSGVKVCIRTDKDFGREILEKSAGIFNFEDLDFNDFTFNTSEYSVIPFNAKFKKYKAIQVICRNDKVNHAFGVLGIIRRYVIGNFAK